MLKEGKGLRASLIESQERDKSPCNARSLTTIASTAVGSCPCLSVGKKRSSNMLAKIAKETRILLHYLRGTILNRIYGIHKNLYFLITWAN